jgi:hypothetical protein
LIQCGVVQARHAVDVQPEILVLVDVSQRAEVVDGAGPGRPRCPDDAEWPAAGLAILRDDRSERLKVDLEIVVGRQSNFVLYSGPDFWYHGCIAPSPAAEGHSAGELT